MIDTHCHIDLYPDPSEVAASADRAGVLTIIVTNLPSAFDRAYPHVRSMKHIRLGLGLHPLAAGQHNGERTRFSELIDKTSYIGEIGLDFSRDGLATKKIQLESFRFVLAALLGKPRFITLHSRRAESAVLEILEENERSPVVFHWYSGALGTLERALSLGHFFSINPAMIGSQKSRRIIDALPPDRVLTESDGPFVTVHNRKAVPSDVALVEDYLAALWQIKKDEVTATIRRNFLNIVGPIQAAQRATSESMAD